jgi:hypothetical protein
MALNLLPLLLIGGGAAVVVTQARKKKEEEDRCPAETTIGFGELATVQKRATLKHGNEATPFNEARFFMKEALPAGCSPADKIRIKLSFEDGGVIDISAADFYMLVVYGALDERVQSGKIQQHQADKFKGDALDWYKKVTGKNFDPQVLLTGLMKGVGNAAKKVLEGMMAGVAGLEKDEEPGGPCPAEWIFEWGPDIDARVDRIVDAEIARENKDPVSIGDALFKSMAPAGCSKTDYHNVVEFVIPGVQSQMGNMAIFYVSLVFQGALRLNEKGLLPDKAMDQIHLMMNAWYKKLTGSDLPEK